MLHDKVEEIAADSGLEERYGSVFVIAAILSIVYYSILLFKECRRRRNREVIYGDLKKIGLREKMVIRRQVKRKFPMATRAESYKLTNLIVERAKTLSYDEFCGVCDYCENHPQ